MTKSGRSFYPHFWPDTWIGKLHVKFAIGSVYFEPFANRLDHVAGLNIHTFGFLTDGIFLLRVIRVVVGIYFGFFNRQPALQNF